MDPIAAAVIAALLGAAIAVAVLALTGRLSRPTPVEPRPDAPQANDALEPVGNPEQARLEAEALLRVIEALPGPVLLLDAPPAVDYASPPALRLGLMKQGKLAHSEIGAVANAAADRSSVVVEVLSLRRPPFQLSELEVRVRAIPLADRRVLLLVDDLIEELRVATVRRDFIANVSHELKTPVGAILLLSEAMMSSGDDVAAVQHFAGRTHAEATRLSNLINDVIDLSRLQGEDPFASAEMLVVDDLVREAMDYVRAAAEAKRIRVAVGGTTGLKVLGIPDQLITAMRNLLANAISYSPEGTQVAVAVQMRDSAVQIAVKDQGIGIAPEDQERIFERFYRVDEARSRVTGGTGLGLAIARNVCRNHGGDLTVWSVPGEGSTFTIQLPQQGGEIESPMRSDA